MEKIIEFENGLRLVVQNMRYTKALSIGVYVGVGSVYEDSANNGISHFIEHMTFKGTTKRSAYDIANELESIGINVNAFTSKNLTAFYTTGLSEYGENCMEILADILYNSTYTEENLEKEREVILEEIKMTADDYEDLCLENLNKAMFGKNKSIAYPILGSSANVKRFGKADIIDFMKQHYVPQNTVISMAGDITAEEAVAMAERYFNTKEISDFSKIRAKKELMHSHYITEIKNENNQAHITIGFPAYGMSHLNYPANAIISNILGGNMSSRLFQRIREQMGLVYTIYASTVAYVKNAYFFIYFATDPSKVEKAVAEVRKVIDEYLQNGVDEAELKKSIIQIKTSMTIGTENSMSVMRANAKSAVLLNKKFNLGRTLDKLDKYDKKTIDSLLPEIFDYEKVSLSYVGKKQQNNILKIFMGA